MSLLQRTFHRLRPTLNRSSAQCVRGLEEFFESKKSIPVDEIKTGRAWEASELRQKSFDDLHKLWYVLLKERNMLETQKEECRRLYVPFIHKQRLDKCNTSMARIKQVLSERQAAWKEAVKAAEKARLKEQLEIIRNVSKNLSETTSTPSILNDKKDSTPINA